MTNYEIEKQKALAHLPVDVRGLASGAIDKIYQSVGAGDNYTTITKIDERYNLHVTINGGEEYTKVGVFVVTDAVRFAFKNENIE